jgi:hypothetical protein
MKLCKDCKFWRKGQPETPDGLFDMCVSPQLGIEPVRGSEATSKCYFQRMMDPPKYCGTAAQFFVPAAPAVIEEAIEIEAEVVPSIWRRILCLR